MVNKKMVGNKWAWFDDYAFGSAKWTINCEPGRTIEVGTGVKIFGEPRGSKTRITTHGIITTLGLGAIHIKVVDGKGSCGVQVDLGEVGLISITIPF